MKLIRVITPFSVASSSWMMKPPSLLLLISRRTSRTMSSGRNVLCPRSTSALTVPESRSRSDCSMGSSSRQPAASRRSTPTSCSAVSFPMQVPALSTTGRKEKWLAVSRSHAFCSVSFSPRVISSSRGIMMSSIRERTSVARGGLSLSKRESTNWVCGLTLPARRGWASSPATSVLNCA